MGGERAGFAPGEIVVSAAGRDMGRAYLVLGEQDGFVLLCDGKRRGLAKPKKKNPNHVTPQGERADLSLISCDAHVRKAIKHFKKIKSEGGCHLG